MSPIGNDRTIPALQRVQSDSGRITLVWCRGSAFAATGLENMPDSFACGEGGIESLLGHSFLQDPPQPEETDWRESALPAAGPIVLKPGKIIALGRTFAAHARELGNEPPKEPLVFPKSVENIVGDSSPLRIPFQEGERFDNEIELAALISRPLRRATREETASGIAGWTMLNDFTWRSEQSRAKAAGAPWFVAKNLPGCLPVGSRFIPYSFVPDPRPLRFACFINDALAQEGDFSGMSGDAVDLISWLSQKIPLNPGDLVALGTPKGVTQVRPGDRIEVSIEGLGALRHDIVGEYSL